MIPKYALILALLTSQSMIYAQMQVLKNYDFDKGGYSLIGMRSESDFNQLAHDLGNFYTDDIQVLNAIKKEWTFKKPGQMHSCGYHYYVYVCKNGLELESFSINLSCNILGADAGYFYFEERQLGRFKNKLKKLSKRDYNRWERYNLHLYDYPWRYHTQWYDLIKSD
jgi:hypothetical protein